MLLIEKMLYIMVEIINTKKRTFLYAQFRLQLNPLKTQAQPIPFLYNDWPFRHLIKINIE